jgi:hypothetical protein
MGRDFLPRGDGQLVQWSRNFSRLLNEDPARWHIDPQRAAGYAVLHDEMEAAYQAATDPGTRTRTAVQSKNAARSRLKREARVLARQITNIQDTTNSDRAELRLTLRTPGSPIARPSEAPVMQIVSADGWQVLVQLRSPGSGRRGKGHGIIQATVWMTIEDEPPPNLKRWKHLFTSGSNRFTVNLPTELAAGTRVWLCAQWRNPRGQAGPACAATGLIVGGGVPRVSTSATAGVRQAA